MINIDDGKFYIGHTNRELQKRINEHKCQRKTKTDSSNRISCKDFNKDNLKFEILEEIKESDFNTIRIKERYYIELYPNCVNKDRPIITNEEMKKKAKESSNNWGLEKINCSCGTVIQKREKSRHERTKKHLKFILP